MKQRILSTIIMSFLLSSFMTLWVTFINLGVTTGFLILWGKAFVLAWPAAALVSFFATPTAQKLAHKMLT